MSKRQAWRDKGSRHERGYDSGWDKLRLRILKMDKYLCQVCMEAGRVTPLAVKPYDHAVDHIIPKAKGGTDDWNNLQSLCKACHDAKSQADAIEGSGGRPQARFDANGWPIWE